MEGRKTLIDKLLGEPLCNLCQSFLDGFVEKNVDFRFKAGVNSVIIRQMLSNCCNWCRNLAGIYDVATVPVNVYQRHDHCNCVVTFKRSDKQYVNVQNKKQFKTYREARLEGLKNIDNTEISKENRIRKLNSIIERKKLDAAVSKALRMAKEKGEKVADVTDAIRNNRLSGNLVVDKLFRKNTKKIAVSEERIYEYDYIERERENAKILSNFYGGTVEIVPRTVTPIGVHSPDYSINGKKAELKHANRKDIRRTIEEGEKQASHIVINLDLWKYGELKDAFKMVEEVFYNKKYDWLEMCTIVKDGKVRKVYKRV